MNVTVEDKFLAWKSIFCERKAVGSKHDVVASNTSYLREPLPTAISAECMQTGCYELTCQLKTLRGCMYVGVVKLGSEAEDGIGMPDMPADDGSRNWGDRWRATPAGGWMDKSKVGLVTYMTEHKEIRNGQTRVLSPGWSLETDSGIRVGGLVSCVTGIGELPKVDDLVVCLPALLDGADLGPGRIIAIHAGEKSCLVLHLELGIKREYSIGRYHEFHLAAYQDLGERHYYFNHEDGTSQFNKPIQGERERIEEGDELHVRYEGYTAVLSNKFVSGQDGQLQAEKTTRGRVEFRVNGRVVGEAKDVQGPVRFGVQFSTIGDGVRLMRERNLVLEVMEESSSPLLAVLGEEGRRALSGRGSYKRWQAGKTVMREGGEEEEEEEGMYFVLSGELVAKQAPRAAKDVDRSTATVGRGALVGEMTVVYGRPPSASIKTKSECELLYFTREGVEPILADLPDDQLDHLEDLLVQATPALLYPTTAPLGWERRKRIMEQNEQNKAEARKREAARLKAKEAEKKKKKKKKQAATSSE